MDGIFAHARLRHVIAIYLVASFVPYALVDSFTTMDDVTPQVSLGSGIVDVIAQVSVFAALWLTWCAQSTPGAVLGQTVNRADARELIWLGVPLVAASVFTLYLLYIPLFYAVPGFVEFWLIDMPQMLAPADAPNTLQTNLVVALSVVVVAPIVEELLFRGFILGRLGAKYGFGRAIIISSLIFGLLHVDVLGAFLFGVVVSLVRLKYDSLIAPTLIHISNNAIAVAWSAFDLYILEAQYEYTMEEFLAYWWWAPLGFAIGVPWLYRYYQRELVQVRWPARPRAHR